MLRITLYGWKMEFQILKINKMKKIIYVVSVIVFTIVSCSKEIPKDYVTISGTITNQNSDSLMVIARKFSKKITVNVDGTFSDTLKITAGNYRLFDGSESTNVYLKNGYDIELDVNTKEFDETITYKGKGAEPNNYLAKWALLKEDLFNESNLFEKNEEDFVEKVESTTNQMSALLLKTKNKDSAFTAYQTEHILGFKKYLEKKYSETQYFNKNLAKGMPSPKFIDYENYAGGTISLNDFKGKYVYIDLWATWCGPCKQQIPFLEKIEKDYHGKNIVFVSISVDREKDYKVWRQMVADKEMSGIQLYAKGDKKFMNDYKVNGIPRFILLDPEGNIVSAKAPIPSSKKLKILFNELNI